MDKSPLVARGSLHNQVVVGPLGAPVVLMAPPVARIETLISPPKLGHRVMGPHGVSPEVPPQSVLPQAARRMDRDPGGIPGIPLARVATLAVNAPPVVMAPADQANVPVMGSARGLVVAMVILVVRGPVARTPKTPHRVAVIAAQGLGQLVHSRQAPVRGPLVGPNRGRVLAMNVEVNAQRVALARRTPRDGHAGRVVHVETTVPGEMNDLGERVGRAGKVARGERAYQVLAGDHAHRESATPGMSVASAMMRHDTMIRWLTRMHFPVNWIALPGVN
jgi:hypothetical protein